MISNRLHVKNHSTSKEQTLDLKPAISSFNFASRWNPPEEGPFIETVVTKDVMAEIKKNTYKIDKNDLDKIKKNFISEMLDENETVEMIKTINDEHQMVVDPHTAVGIGAVKKLGLEKNCVVLSTAHPCKFPKAIEDAISKIENLPDSLKYVNDRKEKFELLSNDIEKVKKYVMSSI